VRKDLEAVAPGTASRHEERTRRVTIQDSFAPKHNSLNLLRLVLALAVVFSHSITVGSFGSESILGKTTLGTLAVYGFFGISGYLIAGSASRNSVGRYLWQRFLRIFPAYWICLLVTAFVLGTISWFHGNPGPSRSCGIHCYLFQSDGPFGYVFHNFWLQGNQYTIRGTLRGALPLGWNASLWTLVYEFLCYLLLAALAAVGLLKRRALVLVLAVTLWIAEIVIISVPALNHDFGPSGSFGVIDLFHFKLFAISLLVLVPIFLSGALIFLYREKLPDSGTLALGATFLVLVGFAIPAGIGAPFWQRTSLNFTAIFLAYALIWLGIHLPLQRVGAVNDYSYGIYIYAFPIQQLLVTWGVVRLGYGPYTLLSIVAVIPLAVASWWVVEKHALRLRTAKPTIPFWSNGSLRSKLKRSTSD
jgi:peptidoglycan/LPS O-acetylase OafA/YrhL